MDSSSSSSSWNPAALCVVHALERVADWVFDYAGNRGQDRRGMETRPGNHVSLVADSTKGGFAGEEQEE